VVLSGQADFSPFEVTMKRIAALLLCLLAVLPVAAISGCESIQNMLYKTAIEKALHEDSLTGKLPTDDHVAAMRKVDLSGCPSDFNVAYVKYIEAWEQAAKIQKAKTELDNDSDAAAAAGALATLFGSDETPWSDHVQAEARIGEMTQDANDQISSDWDSIEQIAAKYGAQVPQ
jgi:hypothetical protein